jgi:3-oxoacyl-[acyl-carrier protein] reductase
MKLNLSDKVILLTGATSGIGQAAVIALSEAGATIAMHYSTNDKAVRSMRDNLGNDSDFFCADLSDLQQTENLFNQVMSKYGKIDVLINNAGVYFPSPISKSSEVWINDWNKTLNVNLTSAALLCKLVIPEFILNRGGRIINIASRAAFRGETEEYFAYAASKGGLVSLTKTIARNYGKESIKAFTVAPGFVRTKMAESFIRVHGEQKVLDELSLLKLTEPDDVAPTILYLSSGTMDHATGSTIDINAGSYLR